jgi:hypothetical protein
MDEERRIRESTKVLAEAMRRAAAGGSGLVRVASGATKEIDALTPEDLQGVIREAGDSPVDEIIEAELARHEQEPNPSEVAQILLPRLTEAQVRQVALEGLVPRVGALMARHKRKGAE